MTDFRFIRNHNLSGQKIAGAVCLLLVTLATVYCVYCAFAVSITFDEAWSWEAARGYPLQGIITYKKFNYANNHILNSLWLYATNIVFPNNLQIMRLPSILSVPLIALGLAMLLRVMQCDAMTPWVIALILFHPVVISHCFQARGYALAVAAEVWALYGAASFIETGQRRFLLLSFVMAAISSLAIFSFAFFVVGLLAYLFGRQLWLRRHNFSGKNFLSTLRHVLFWPESVVVLLPLAYVYHIGSKIVQQNLYIPGSTSFLFGTYASILSDMVGFETYPRVLRTSAKITISCLVVAACFVTFRLLAKRRHLTIPLKQIGLITILTIAAMYCAHFADGTPFAMGRTALFLYIPSVIYMAILAKDFPSPRTLRWSSIVAVLILLNFFYVDLVKTRVFLSDGPREVLSSLRSYHLTPGSERLACIDTDPLSPAWHYYKDILDLKNLSVEHLSAAGLTQEAADSYDFLYAPVETYRKLSQSGTSPFIVVGWFNDQKYVLLENAPRKNQLLRQRAIKFDLSLNRTKMHSSSRQVV
jgi:hypothetical protein